MKKLLRLLGMLLFVSGLSFAQTTTVSATVTDSDNTLWANGTVSVQFVPNPLQSSLNAYRINGAPLSSAVIMQGPISLGSGGSFSTTVYDNTQVTPSGSQWQFTVCPNAISKCGSVTTVVSGSGQSITTLVDAAIPAPRFPATAGSYGYADVEAILSTPVGGTYWNVVSACQKYYNGSSWNCVSSSSGAQINLGATQTGAIGASGTATFPGTVAAGTSVTAPNIGGTYYFSHGMNGAVCDDATDDSTALISTIATACSAGGGVIYVNGMCRINSTIVIPYTNSGQVPGCNLRITGSGPTYNTGQGIITSMPAALDLQYNPAPTITITAWSITSNVATFTAANSLPVGKNVMLSGFGTSTFFNDQQVVILAAGLSGTQFLATFYHADGSATESGAGAPFVSKIDARGTGILEIDHIGLVDHGSDCIPFVQVTSTTPNIHDTLFQGSRSGTAACNDAIVFGGATPNYLSGPNTDTNKYNGYGAAQSFHNYFDKIRRWGYFRAAANAINFKDSAGANTNGSSCLGNASDGAAFLIDSNTPVSGKTDTGNMIVGNLIEAGNYCHGVAEYPSTALSTLGPNGIYDTSGSWLSTYLLNSTSSHDQVTEGYSPDVGGTDITGTDAGWGEITTHSNISSSFPTGIKATGASNNNWFQASGTNSIRLIDGLNTATNDEWYLTGNGGGLNFYINPLGGGVENWLRMNRVATGAYTLTSPSATTYFKLQAASGPLYLESGAGGTVWFGDQSGQNMHYISGTNVLTVGSVYMSGTTRISTLQDFSGNGAAITYKRTLTSSAAGSDNLTIGGVTSTSVCAPPAPTNSAAATANITTQAYVSAKTTNQITVTHAVTAGMTYDIICAQ